MSGKKELTALTALKGIFCLVIAIHNTLDIQFLFQNVPGSSMVLLFGGTMGNSVFLTLSGFLFAYSYRERIQNREISFPKFLLRRMVKLYPLYLLTNGVSLVLSILKYGPSCIDLNRIVGILLLQNFSPYNAPTWFLAALFACYVLFFFIAYRSENSTQYFCGITLCALLGLTLQADLPFCGTRYCFAYLNFFTGCILAEVYPMLLKKNLRWLPHACLAVLGMIGILFLKYGVQTIAGDVSNAFSLAVTPLILYIALSDSIYSRLLRIRPLQLLGKISTSVYFWHLPLFCLFLDVIIRKPITEGQYLIYMAMLLVCSALSCRYIENRRSGK